MEKAKTSAEKENGCRFGNARIWRRCFIHLKIIQTKTTPVPGSHGKRKDGI
jgi:hypothetical protein